MTTNNLHRELAPVSAAAWAEIEEEVSRTFKRNIAGRRVVDMPEPKGIGFSALTTGHVVPSATQADDVLVQRRRVIPVIELRAPFTVTRAAVDDVLRGSVDSDWQPAKDAATAIAKAEDSIVFYGNDEHGMGGIARSSSNEEVALPENVVDFPDAVALALSRVRLAGVEGPYTLLLSAELYTLVNETTHNGYPVLEHIQRVLKDGKIVWAPALDGALVVSERGGDYELQLGQDLSIGYDSHDAERVNLYLQETLVFRVATEEASVVLH